MIAEHYITQEEIDAAQQAAEAADAAASRAYEALACMEKRAQTLADEADRAHAYARRLACQRGFRRLVEVA